MTSSEVVTISYSSLITSAVLEELEAAGCDAADAVTVVCQGGERVRVSCVLLAAMSPYVASLLRTVADRDDCVILLPDVQADCVKDVVRNSLRSDNPTSFTDNKSVVRLDGLFWNLESPFQKNWLTDLDKNLKLLAKEIKLEPKFEMSEPGGIGVGGVPVMMMMHDPTTMMPGKPIVMGSSSDVSLSSKRKRTDWSSKKRSAGGGLQIKRVKKEELGIEGMEEEDQVPLDFDFEVDGYDGGDVFQQAAVHEPNIKLHVSSSDEEGSRNPVFGVKKEKKKKLSHKSGGSKKRGRPRKNNDGDEVGAATGKKREKGDKAALAAKKKLVYSDEKHDDEFVKAQEALRADILDSSNLEDPYLLICKYHDLNPKLHYLRSQSKEVKLICPVCNLVLPTWKGLVSHLREYKYKNFSCSCVPEDKSDKHLQSKHWNWTACGACSELVFPPLMPNHRLFKHNDKEALYCGECDKYFEKRHSFYWDHMDKHIINKENCGCSDITFENKSHKKYHIQVVHLKQKVGCSKKKCYFLCDTQQELEEHVNSKHIKKPATVEDDVVKPVLICDICGQTMQSRKPDAVEIHKARMHDTVKVQCPQCPHMFTPLSLKGHLRKVHSGGVCNICGVKVNQLQKHINEQHSVGKKMYKCEYCPKQFYYLDMFKKHLNTHLKQNVYPCRYGCEFPYTDSSNRNHHEKKKHGQLYSASVHNNVRDE